MATGPAARLREAGETTESADAAPRYNRASLKFLVFIPTQWST